MLAENDPYAPWYLEALEHAGLMFEKLDSVPENRLAQFDLFLLCGNGVAPDQALIELWLNQSKGRALVVSGGTWGLNRLLGVNHVPEHPRFVHGQVTAENSPLFPDQAWRARFYGGPRVRVNLANSVVETADQAVAVSQLGQAWLVAPHVGQTIAFLQLGQAVETDGSGPEDGSAHWDVGPPRAEYGTRIPFEDRTDGVFGIPHADLIKELWIRTVLVAAKSTGKRAAMLWHLPRNANHMGVLTLDCDTTNSTDLFNLNATLLMTNTRATVLTRHGGYGPDVYGWLKRVGHEVGLTFDPNVAGGWHPDRFRMDLSSLMRLASIGPITTARVIGGGWRGWMQPYEIFAHAGTKGVVSKGGTEPGTAGFLFGTCHPFYPVRPDGRALGALEFPHQLFNVGVTSPNEPVESIVNQVAARHGVLHGVTSLSMVHQDAGFSGLKRWISIFKQSQGDFITLEKLQQFERARRQLRINVEQQNTLQIESEEPLDGLTVMVQGRDVLGAGLSGRTAPQMVHRYGQDFIAFTLNLGDRRVNDLRLQADRAA